MHNAAARNYSWSEG